MYAVVRISKVFNVETRKHHIGIAKIVGCYKSKYEADKRAEQLTAEIDELKVQLYNIGEKPRAERTKSDLKFSNDYANNHMDRVKRYEVEAIGFFK